MASQLAPWCSASPNPFPFFSPLIGTGEKVATGMIQAAYQLITSHLEGEWIETQGAALYWDLSSAISPPAQIWVSPWSSLKIQRFKFFISFPLKSALEERDDATTLRLLLCVSPSLFSTFSLSSPFSPPSLTLCFCPFTLSHSDVRGPVRLNFEFVRSALRPRRDSVGGLRGGFEGNSAALYRKGRVMLSPTCNMCKHYSNNRRNSRTAEGFSSFI